MKNSFIALALSVAPAIAIPPEDFGFPTSQDDTPLSVVYPGNDVAVVLEPGTLFGIDVPAQAPQILVNETYPSLQNDDSSYLLLMVDPDASYPENPQNRFIIHWWQEGLVKDPNANNLIQGGQALMNNSAPRVSYRRPRPPTNSSAHRYIQYLFEQPANFQVPQQYSGYGDSNSNITRFPLQQFLADVQLDSPVAANYFYCSNQTAVPDLFVGAPGGTYPGGNGAMITQGENLPMSTSMASSTPTSQPSASVSPFVGAASKVDGARLGLVLAVGGAWALL